MADGYSIERSLPGDRDEIVHLLGEYMGWAAPGLPSGHADRMFRWKHETSPFGPSPIWVARRNGSIIGVRAFMRWQFGDGRGGVTQAVRAVDTVTHPAARGSGVFRSLTMAAVEQLTDDGVEFVFNTPNDQSRPGYLRMGWSDAGRVATHVALLRPRRLASVVRSRHAAASLSPAPPMGTDDTLLGPLDDGALRSHVPDTAVCGATQRTLAWLRWRFADSPYRYSIVSDPTGSAVVRLRSRGTAIEATIADLAPPDTATAPLRRVLRRAGADLVVTIGERPPELAWQTLGGGPTLVVRPLAGHPPASGLRLGTADIELF